MAEGQTDDRERTQRVKTPKPDKWPPPVMAIDHKVKLAGYVREVPGYRTLMIEIPASVLRRYLVEHREPDVKQIAEAHMANFLWSDSDWAEKR